MRQCKLQEIQNLSVITDIKLKNKLSLKTLIYPKYQIKHWLRNYFF